MSRFLLTLSFSLLFAASAVGAPIEVVLDPTQSDLTIEICMSGMCAVDTTPISGYHLIDIDSLEDPTQIWLYDFAEFYDEDIVLVFDFGWLGAFTQTLSGIVTRFHEPSDTPIGPVPIVDNVYSFDGVPVVQEGIFSYVATGAICATHEGVERGPRRGVGWARAFVEGAQQLEQRFVLVHVGQAAA